jgi:uncharacterized protein YndB with AHSA1/START domain
MQWWGPRDYTTPAFTFDPRPGGVCLCCMRSQEGREIWNKGVIQEIIEPERLVLLSAFSDAAGNTVSPAQYGMPDWPEESLMTITFEEQDGGTRISIHETVPLEIAQRYQAPQGWHESLDRLDDLLAAEVRSGD